jgi:flagellar FliL protein
MADAAPADDAAAPRRRRRPLVLGAVLAVVAAGAGFAVTYTGRLFAPAAEPAAAVPAEDIAFVPIDPVIVSLPPGGSHGHLRMAAQLEVAGGHAAEVAHLAPRILDVLNGYLRAVEIGELEDPAALVRIRAQLLRRIQIVTGEGRVRDLLVTEFVLN